MAGKAAVKKLGAMILSAVLFAGVSFASGSAPAARSESGGGRQTVALAADEPVTWGEPSGVSDFGDFTALVKSVEAGDYVHNFYNYQKGAVYARFKKSDSSQSGHQYWGSLNFPDSLNPQGLTDAALTRTEVKALASEYVDMTEWVGREHESGSTTTINNILSSAGSTLNFESLQTAYKDYYTANIKGKYALGTDKRGINTWDGNIVQPFADGEGMTVIDNNRNATFLIFNVKDEEVFMLRNEAGAKFSSMSASEKQSMGDVLDEQHEVALTGEKAVGAVVYSGDVIIQHTANGVFITDGEHTDWLSGEQFDETSGKFRKFPSPAVSSDYGILQERMEGGGGYYINYSKGCVFAKTNALGTGYTYTFYPGRNFDEDDGYSRKLLPMEMFISSSLLSIDPTSRSDFGDKTDEEIKALFVAAYKRFYDIGYFIGSLESNIKGWNNVVGQQFKTGDSNARPWGDGRANIAFLAYNATNDEVYLIRDGGLAAFDAGGSSATAYGAPIEDPLYHQELGIYTQRFSRMTGPTGRQYNIFLVYNGRNAYLMDRATMNNMDIETKNYTGFLEAYADQDRISTHEKDADKGYIDEGVLSYEALGLPPDISFPKGKK